MINNKIIIAAGGTGGHIFPAQALAEELVKKKIPFTFICDKRTVKFLQDPLKNAPKKIISATQLSGNIFKKILAIFNLAQSIISVLYYLLLNRPAKIIGFGGYPSFPTLLAGVILRIPIYIHEQNSVLGRVNSYFLPFCTKIFITFPYTEGLKAEHTNKVKIIGNLTRASILPKKLTKKPTDPLTILIMGGSQGAKSISTIIPKSLSILASDSQKNLKIYLQARQENIDEAKAILKGFKGSVMIKSFFDNIGEIMNESDLVISRAGASTIAEIITMSKPSILIPYPHAKDNHQFYNAKYLADNDSCLLIEEKDISPENFAHELEKILMDTTILTFFSKNIKKLYIEEPQSKFLEELLI